MKTEAWTIVPSQSYVDTPSCHFASKGEVLVQRRKRMVLFLNSFLYFRINSTEISKNGLKFPFHFLYFHIINVKI
jgi:hypothetical protein